MRLAAFALSLALLGAPLVAEDDLESWVATMARIGASWSPSFSPDGRRVAFVSNLSGLPQVWTVSAEGGWPDLVTPLSDPVGSVSWSPDGAWLAFSLAPGVVNFATFFAHTEPWMAAISKGSMEIPTSQAEMLRSLSPIHKVDRVKAPTIVLHGANDTNVPVVEAEQVVQSLKTHGVPVEYVLFPDEGHGFRKIPNRIRSTVSIVRWFETYLKPRPASP